MKKTEITQELKDGYYDVSDGLYKMQDQIVATDVKSKELIEKMITLNNEIDEHLGGV